MSTKDSAKKTDQKMSDAATPAKQQVHVVDVSHPGKSTPSATSRPVIVGSGSYMKDPMVSQPAAEVEPEAAPTSEKLTASGGKVISPLNESEQEAVQDKADVNQPEDTAPTPGEPAKDEPSQATEDSTKANDNKEAPTDSSESAVVEAVLGQVDEKGNTVEDNSPDDDHITQLIQDKKYFVNVSKPKQSHVSLIVTILSIVVILATIAVVADAYDIISLL